MKQATTLLIALALLFSLAGCGNGVQTEPPATDTGTVTSEPVITAPEGLEAIPTDGPGESAARAAIPGLLDQARQMREGSGQPWPELGSIEPRLVAYLVAVTMDDQVTLFEVRADGIAHELYAYHRAFDAGSLIWTPASMTSTISAAPQSDREKAAVAAIEAAMKDSFPDTALATGVQGYRFVYLDGNTQVLTLEVATDGAIISVGS
jgi:hypothetical protein